MSASVRKGPEGQRAGNKDTTVYVGNLDIQTTDALLYELMSQIAPVVDVKMPKDRVLRTHQGYGFVVFKSVKDAEYAQQLFNGLMLYNRPIKVRRVSNQHRPGTTTGGATGVNGSGSIQPGVGAILFIGNLNKLIDEKTLSETFSNFGSFVEPPRVIRDDSTGESKGIAFVSFTSFEASDKAIEELNGHLIMNQPMKVEYAYKKDGKNGERHGDEVERLLAKKAAANNYITDKSPSPATLMLNPGVSSSTRIETNTGNGGSNNNARNSKYDGRSDEHRDKRQHLDGNNRESYQRRNYNQNGGNDGEMNTNGYQQNRSNQRNRGGFGRYNNQRGNYQRR